MSQSEIMMIAQDMVTTAACLAGPAILVSMIVGTLVSILQTITSIQEQTLSFAPRMVAVFLVILLTLPWMMQIAMSFTLRMMEYAARVTG